MKIEVRIRLDRRQLPYWSAMAIHERNVVLETQSEVFNPRNAKDFRERFENVTARIMKELQANPKHAEAIKTMLLQEPAPDVLNEPGKHHGLNGHNHNQ